MGNNEIMAIANAREIEKLPYETLKGLTFFYKRILLCVAWSAITGNF